MWDYLTFSQNISFGTLFHCFSNFYAKGLFIMPSFCYDFRWQLKAIRIKNILFLIQYCSCPGSLIFCWTRSRSVSTKIALKCVVTLMHWRQFGTTVYSTLKSDAVFNYKANLIQLNPLLYYCTTVEHNTVLYLHFLWSRQYILIPAMEEL